MKFTKAVLLLVISGVVAFGQSAPAFGVFQGTASTPASLGHPCGDSSNIGSLYTQQANGGQAQVCLQTGANSLGAGAYAWTPLQTTSTSGGGSLVIASGKTVTINNSLTFSGTDATTMTFPGASDTVVTLGATQTLTAKTLTTPTITLPVIGDTTDATKSVIFSTSGGTTAVATTLTFAPTSARTVTFPNASITVPGTILTSCGSSASCASPTNQSSIMKVVTGTIAFSSATTASVTGISPAFTSATSFTCSAYNGTHNYTWNFTTQTTTGFTLTAGTSNSDTWAYVCSGY